MPPTTVGLGSRLGLGLGSVLVRIRVSGGCRGV